MRLKTKECLIVAPFPSAELVGCFSLIKKNPNVKFGIIYSASPNTVSKEVIQSNHTLSKVKNSFNNIYYSIYLATINSVLYFKKDISLFFPDHNFENIFEIKHWGIVGETIARKGQENVFFYNLQMNAPYVHELTEYLKEEKLYFLNKLYDSKNWEAETRIISYEGYCSWHF